MNKKIMNTAKDRMGAIKDYWDQKLSQQGSRSYLRSDFNLQGTNSSINFNILANQGSPSASENRLQLADAFVVTHIGFYLLKAGTSTSATATEIAQAVPHTFPNPLVFTGSGEAANLEVLYNSSLTLKLNQVVWYPYLAMRKFYRVGTSQATVGSSAVNNSPVQRDEWNGPDYGSLPLIPPILFNGQGQNSVVINMAASVATSGTSSTNLISFVADGILYPNCASKLGVKEFNVFRQ